MQEESQTQFPQLEIKQFNAFALWKWKSDELNKICNICKNSLTQVCLNCEATNNNNEEQIPCYMAQGQCSHVFHKHCIEKWILDKSHGSSIHQCAYCSEQWDINQQIVQ